MSHPHSIDTDTESTVQNQPSKSLFETALTENVLVACSDFPIPKWVYVVGDGIYRLQTPPEEVHKHHYVIGVSQPNSSGVELLSFEDVDAETFQCLIPKFPSEEEIEQRVGPLTKEIPLGSGSHSVNGATFEVGDVVGCDSFIAVILDALGDDLLVYNVEKGEYQNIQPRPLFEDISDGYYTHYKSILSQE